MSVDAGPPIQPPQLSPDGKYVWDGSNWQPIAGAAEATHAGVFPSWNSIQVDPADPTAPASTQPMPADFAAPVQFQPAAPAIDYSYAPAEPSTPLWQQPNKGVSTYLYFGGGLAILVMAMLVLNSLNIFQLPFFSAGSSSSKQSSGPSPTPDTSGSDFVRADRFLNQTLAPAVLGFDDTLPALEGTCNGTLNTTCFNAVTATDGTLANILSVIQHGDVPNCIAMQLNKVRLDFAGMHTGLQGALNGFQTNRVDVYEVGIHKFIDATQPFTADAKALDQAQKKDCHKMVLPTWVP